MRNPPDLPGRGTPSRARASAGLPRETLEGRSLSSGVTATFQTGQNWGSGFQAFLSIHNTQAGPVKNWRLEFDYDAAVTWIWDAKIVSRSGSRYVLEGAGWNNDLPARGTVSIGFLGSPGNTSAQPSNYLLNGAPLGTILPSLSVTGACTVAPQSGSSLLSFPVSLSSPSSMPVSVHYATVDGSAIAGSDYSATSGTLTFAPGETASSISVPILMSRGSTGAETFQLMLSNPSGASLDVTRASGTIQAPPQTRSPDVLFAVTSDWGTGFNGYLTIRNSTRTPWTSWTLSFDFAGKITSIRDASIDSRIGNHYVIRNADHDGPVKPGGSVSFGFTGTRSCPSAAPTDASVRGMAPSLIPPTDPSGSG